MENYESNYIGNTQLTCGSSSQINHLKSGPNARKPPALNENQQKDIQEQERLYYEVFDCNSYYFTQVLNTFFARKARKKMTFTNVTYDERETIFPKICEALDLQMIIKPNNCLTLKKNFSLEEKKELKNRTQAKKILREERRIAYGPDYVRILKQQGKLAYDYDYKTILAEAARMRMDRELSELQIGDAPSEVEDDQIKKERQVNEDKLVDIAETDSNTSNTPGYRLLLAMCKKQGEKLGLARDGIMQPIAITRRPKKDVN